MKHHLYQFMRYGAIGVLNTLLSFGIFNFFIFVSGVTQGLLVTLFSAVTFAVVITHSFFWNKYFVFNSHDRALAHKEYIRFFVLTGTVALVNVGVISLLVNGIGAPQGISPHLWANIAVLITIPISVCGNFMGYKFLVFKDQKFL